MLSAEIGIIASALSGDPRQAAAEAQESGFGGLQFDALNPAFDLTTLSASGRREFGRMLGQKDQRLIGLRAAAGSQGLGLGADVDRLLSRWDSILETAAGLAAPLVCLNVGPLPLPTEKSPEVEWVSQVDAALADLGRRADRYSVIVALSTDLASFAALHRAIQAAHCPWFGVDFDPVGLLVDDWTLNDAMAHWGSLIRHVRGRDALLGADRRTRATALGAGSTDWRSLAAALDEAGYQGWITLDPTDLTDRRNRAIAGLNYLRKLSL